MRNLKEIITCEDGQGMVEYVLILGLIAVAAVVALIALGPKILAMFQKASDSIPAKATSSTPA